MRADLMLVDKGLAPSRSRARELIEAGAVTLHGGTGSTTVLRPSTMLGHDAKLSVDEAARLRYVSRGGLKLEGALRETGIGVSGLHCLDVGQSTGGFTDCLLQAGAARVVGIDVGHAQLHPSLRQDPRVGCFEGLNIRHLAHPASSAGGMRTGQDAGFAASVPAGGFDLVVIDLRFISLSLALPAAAGLLRVGGEMIALVKPQFEVGPGGVDSRGLVRDSGRYPEIRIDIEARARANGLGPAAWFESPVRGGDGNREFFLHARRACEHASDLQWT
jgi:23S rRNA (cytidine1920-2'-O)/16S rRNA (cytidine1409-2'-O)-methyltransferase